MIPGTGFVCIFLCEEALSEYMLARYIFMPGPKVTSRMIFFFVARLGALVVMQSDGWSHDSNGQQSQVCLVHRIGKHL